MKRDDPLSPSMRDILAAIESAAANGRRCPSNAALASLVGAHDGYGSKAVADLELRGLIEVQRGHKSRVVKVIATGKCTIDDATKDSHRRAFVGPAQSNPPYPLDQYVQRDPCWFCGVRADAGCKHRSAM